MYVVGYETIGLILLNYLIKDEVLLSPHPPEIVHLLVEGVGYGLILQMRLHSGHTPVS